ncbi:MAG TPA: hypothetical protein VGU45_01200 [Microvirga sp.]|jgi:hypothetical protein|nr:hypothetical protein [Microvirga sp.]
MTKRSYPKVLARTDSGPIQPVGREAETLLKLVEAGERGVRAYDFPGGPPFRLGAYVHDLRRMGLSIRTDRESHAGGSHGVYVLETPVSIVTVLQSDEAANAV